MNSFATSHFNRNKAECMTSLDENHETLLETPLGNLEGINYTVGTLLEPFHAQVALGVAYAYNTIGEFRFRRPINVPSFSMAATKRFGRHCFPYKNYAGLKDFNEDCLFLNIFMPFDDIIPMPKNGYPVLFFIHGGMFNYGTSEDLDITAIVKNYVQRGIAVVTPNYRLGPFGFYQTRARNVAYNVALWDLELAFQYMILSSEYLQLDRTKITLAGVDGGAVLAELLSLRHEIRANISGLILIGGSALTPWAMSPGVYDLSIKLAKDLGINTADPMDIGHDLKMLPASAIFEKLEATKDLSKDGRDFIEYTPDFDREFFYYSSLKKTFYEAREIDIYIITTRNEGSIR
uniref:Carboxylesterase type B domain-containing protein n=1 Tax=Panagrolaimus sp. PS1159 TaxID=55785 RepID=A0AC35F0U7_9BILA